MADTGDAERGGGAPPRPPWMAWRPAVPRWLPQDGPRAYGSASGVPQAGSPAVIDHDALEFLVYLAVGVQWAIVVLIAPVVLLVRLVRRHM